MSSRAGNRPRPGKTKQGMRILLYSIGWLVVSRLHQERAQNSFEYLLVVGAVVVAIVGVMIAGFALLIPEVAGHVCPSVDTAADPVSTVGSCLGSLGG